MLELVFGLWLVSGLGLPAPICEREPSTTEPLRPTCDGRDQTDADESPQTSPTRGSRGSTRPCPDHRRRVTPGGGRTNDVTALLSRANEATALISRTNEVTALLSRANEVTALLLRTNEVTALLSRTNQIQASLTTTTVPQRLHLQQPRRRP